MKLKLFLTFLIIIIFQILLAQTSDKPEVNIVYGDKHIFTIETPKDWINNREAAKTINLVCFFYPKSESDNEYKNYFYANGIDKLSTDESLKDFIDADIKSYSKNTRILNLILFPLA